MNSFCREKTIDLGGEYKDVDIFFYSGKRQAAANGRRAKKKNETAPAQKNLNDERSKRYLVWLIKKNFGSGDLHLTLTYDDLNLPPTVDEANRRVRNYIRRLRYYLKSIGQSVKRFKYIVVTSVYSTDGEPSRVHHHIFMSAVKDRDAVEALWAFGAADADRIQNFYNAINKLSGYVAKQTSGDKRWFASKNLDRPKSRANDNKYSPAQIKRIMEYHVFDPSFWEKKYPGWEILDKDYDIKVTVSELSGPYIRLQLHRKKEAGK